MTSIRGTCECFNGYDLRIWPSSHPNVNFPVQKFCTCMGQITIKQGIRVDPAKVASVQIHFGHQPIRKNSVGFLGSDYRRFVLDYSKVQPPQWPTKKDTPFQWSEKCEATVQTLKIIKIDHHYNPHVYPEVYPHHRRPYQCNRMYTEWATAGPSCTRNCRITSNPVQTV